METKAWFRDPGSPPSRDPRILPRQTFKQGPCNRLPYLGTPRTSSEQLWLWAPASAISLQGLLTDREHAPASAMTFVPPFRVQVPLFTSLTGYFGSSWHSWSWYFTAPPGYRVYTTTGMLGFPCSPPPRCLPWLPPPAIPAAWHRYPTLSHCTPQGPAHRHGPGSSLPPLLQAGNPVLWKWLLQRVRKGALKSVGGGRIAFIPSADCSRAFKPYMCWHSTAVCRWILAPG